MNYQHQELAAGRWKELTFPEQMANIGSEVERAIHWKSKNNNPYSQKAFERALELVDLTLDSTNEFPRLKEVARMREMLVDYLFGANEYHATEKSWRQYFLAFNFLARKNHDGKA